jgi:hypothetical protein
MVWRLISPSQKSLTFDAFLRIYRMVWLHHVFAIWVLGHMLWTAIVLEKEWRRTRRFGGSAAQGFSNMPNASSGAET